MADLNAASFVALVAGRSGHFRLESGLHAPLWLDLDALFANDRDVAPYVAALVERLRPYRPEAVCGPLLGGAFLAQLIAQKLEIEFVYAERVADAAESGALFRARYAIPTALHARIAHRRIALVDDVMSAGSSLRAAYHGITELGGRCVVSGALLLLGEVGATWFGAQGVPVEAPLREAFATWPPATCPLCAAGVPVTDPITPAV